ncbi:MAG: crossover junction endodeoxyribonuclease RuvC [Candidatus Latescibacteria bacterium]|nr:crossover junction endodeoxyribonuclease RuvC [Candidatus Latescibacterota bacterium]
MKILGVDPGLQVTGYGLLDNQYGNPVLIEAGVIRSVSKQPLEQRLLDLYTGLNAILTEFRPDVLSVEELYSHYNHPRTAVIMGHARGIIFLTSGMQGIPVFSYSATRIKKSLTGSGHASKDQIARMICRVLQCEKIKGPGDVTDALAAALCHLNVISHGGIL